MRESRQEVRDKLASLEGNSVLLNFEAKGKLEDIHQNLLKDGLAFHTLVPHTGGATIYAAIVDPKDIKATVAAAKTAAGRYDSKITYHKGRSEFIGTQSDTGSDREQRDAARAIYERNIERSTVPGSQAVWDRIRSTWGKGLGIKALVSFSENGIAKERSRSGADQSSPSV